MEVCSSGRPALQLLISFHHQDVGQLKLLKSNTRMQSLYTLAQACRAATCCRQLRLCSNRIMHACRLQSRSAFSLQCEGPGDVIRMDLRLVATFILRGPDHTSLDTQLGLQCTSIRNIVTQSELAVVASLRTHDKFIYVGNPRQK